jgi:hypothetical protein
LVIERGLADSRARSGFLAAFAVAGDFRACLGRHADTAWITNEKFSMTDFSIVSIPAILPTAEKRKKV